ncbi:putative cytokinetic ring protein SteA [Corynebacterium senegalense]|uniref:putative cytokinetic ring protein SteA n=1 Tax=Corynebacterium senegalense TaxID=2080750 RepID=UPI000E20C195|nr:putative cytokinetic ring protein SteA [Corynebacterium senegalense]
MLPMSVFSRASGESPAPAESSPAQVQGTLRDCTARGTSRVKAGDIAVVNSPNMNRREAELLIDAKPAAVVNLAAFSTGSMPNYGPHLLLDAGIALFEEGGDALGSALRDGRKGAVTADGQVFSGKKLVGEARPVERESMDATFLAAQRSLLDHMEAYFGNTIEFIHSESPLLIDGVGVPEMGDAMAGRKVLVVAPGPQAREKVGRLRNFIREYKPVLIGVGSATDALAESGYAPDFIVGDPADVAAENLRGDARVVLPADPDGHAAGLERIQDLGVGAMTFPAATDSPLDLAILLAAFHGAEMIVTVGDAVDLDAIFAGDDHSGPAALLTRLKAGSRVVDSSVIENLYALQPRGGLAWAWAILGLLVAVATVVLVVGLGGDGSFADNLVDTWNAIALKFQNWVR